MLFCVELDLSNNGVACRHSGHGCYEGVGRQVLELGHAQIGDGQEVVHCPEATGSGLGLMEQSVRGFYEGVGATIEHPRCGAYPAKCSVCCDPGGVHLPVRFGGVDGALIQAQDPIER